MILRYHQQKTVEVCEEILKGRNVKEILLSVTAGGGKSFVPVILAQYLIPSVAEKICWVVPRNALKYQGEEEFLDPKWNTNKRVRAAENGNDLSRGLDGYVTTYQAVGEDPECHRKELEKHRYILFLDECHHVAKDSTWETALVPMISEAAIVVYASGTLSRDDGKKIAFMKYSGNVIDLSSTENREVIIYGRNIALKEGAIHDVEVISVDATAEWQDTDGTQKKAKLSDAADGTKALYTALRTDYAEQLIRMCIDSLRKEQAVYSRAKMLVVAPDIETSKTYLACIPGARIAVSEDTEEAHKNISDFKSGKFDILVTVAMAYEGLSVPSITHICCLTQIRSVPWLEQMLARANRKAEGKTHAVCFAPHDTAMLEAVKKIREESLIPIGKKQRDEIESAGEGKKRQWIIPLSSRADNIYSELPELDIMPSSDIEKTLRSEINESVEGEMSRHAAGNRLAMMKVIRKRIRHIVDKPIADMTIPELIKVKDFTDTLKK